MRISFSRELPTITNAIAVILLLLLDDNSLSRRMDEWEWADDEHDDMRGET